MAKIERDLSKRLANYQARIEDGRGLLSREWDDMKRLECHFKQQKAANRILLDEKPATITGWSSDGKIVDLLMDDGRQTWSHWPSPRLAKLEPELDPSDAPTK